MNYKNKELILDMIKYLESIDYNNPSTYIFEEKIRKKLLNYITENDIKSPFKMESFDEL